MTTKTAAQLREAVAKQYANFYDHESDLEMALDGIEYAANLYSSLNGNAMLPAAQFLIGLDKVPNLVKCCTHAWHYRLAFRHELYQLMIDLASMSYANLDDFRVLEHYHRNCGSPSVFCAKIALHTSDDDYHKSYMLEKLEIICEVINTIMER